MLYEVITEALLAEGAKALAAAREAMDRQAIHKAVGLIPILRELDQGMANRNASVITSYSIHYTKLYERKEISLHLSSAR